MKTKRVFLFCMVLLFLGTGVVFSQVIANNGRYNVVSCKVDGVTVDAGISYISYAVYTNNTVEYVFNRTMEGLQRAIIFTMKEGVVMLLHTIYVLLVEMVALGLVRVL